MKRKLGNSGIEISAIGLGCHAIGGEFYRKSIPLGWSGIADKESLAAIRYAVEMGVNFIDTADIYGCGHSEKLIAMAISEMREKVFLATKFGFLYNEKKRTLCGTDSSPKYIRWACEQSLRRLNTDYIDLYQFHLADSNNGLIVREVLEELVQEGKIRYYGWSTDNLQNAKVFEKGEHFIAIQQGFNIFFGNDETISFCEEHNLASVCRAPLGKGLLTGKFTKETKFPPNDLRHNWNLKKGWQADQLNAINAIKDILTNNGRTIAQGAICWLWARSPNTIPIPGFRNIEQVKENIGALTFGPLTNEEMQEIDNIKNLLNKKRK